MSESEPLRSLEGLLAEGGLEARLSVQSEDGTWIDRSRLVDSGDTSVEYIVSVENDSQSRYTLSTEGTEQRVVARKRFAFPVERKRNGDHEDNVQDDLKIVIEVTDSGEVPETLPWESDPELRISSDLLKDDTEISPVNADRVAGLESEKQRLGNFLRASAEDWGLSEATGIILEGPPGTGKTELVIEVCQERYGSIPVTISGPEILSKWVGESERMLRKKFEEAWNTEHKVLYIDELDAIARSRNEASESYSAQIVAQLLVLLDGVETKERSEDVEKSLKVIASTNLSHVVDPALRRPGRLGNRPIRFSCPDESERKAILHHYLENVYRSADGKVGTKLKSFIEGESLECLDDIVEKTDGFTGADIEDLIQASVNRLRESGANDKLSRERLLDVVANGGFESEQDFSETELDTESQHEIDGQVNLDYSTSAPGVYHLQEEDPKVVASRYFREVEQRESQGLTHKLRVASPKDILDDDPTRTRENVVQAFQHRETERVALYLQNAGLLFQAQGKSSLVDRIVGVLNEQFLQWDEENLLVVPEEAGSDLLDTRVSDS